MKQSKHRKEFRKFQESNHFSDASNGKFHLLPFNFSRLESGREVLINLVGDFLIVPEGTVKNLLKCDRATLNDALYKDLISKSFIHDSEKVKNIEFLANRYRTAKSFSFGFTKLHMFVITLRCEHTCKYCQVSRVSQNKDKYDLDRENLVKAIHLMLQCPDEDLTMEFQGGESLLAFENIKFAVEYTIPRAKELGKNMRYVICTNLDRVDEQILEYCHKRSILISTSLDGPDFVHDFNRKLPGKSSHGLAVKGIELAQKRLGVDRVSALMTTSTESLKYPIEIIDEYRRLGFKSIFLRPISPYGFAVYNKQSHYLSEEFLDFYRKGLNYILDLNKQGERFSETYASIILKRMFTAFSSGYVDLMSPTGLLNNAVIYDYNGKIYVSDESRMLAQMKDEKFYLGTVDQSWEDLLKNPIVGDIADSGINDYLAGCDSCAYNVYCGADPVNHHATQGDMYGNRPTSSYCKRNMGVMDILFELLDADPENEKIFKSWVKNG